MSENFDEIAEAYEDAMLSADYTTALAIQAGLNQAITDATAQQAFAAGQEQGLQMAQQAQQQPQADEAAATEAYGTLFDTLDKRKAAVGAERDQQTVQKIIDTARGSYHWLVKQGEK